MTPQGQAWQRIFIGREAELASLLKRFREASPRLHAEAEGRLEHLSETENLPKPSMVVLRGESGHGKSRIVQEFYRRIACSTDDADLPLDPDDYWPDAFGDPDASGKLVNPVIPVDQTRKKIPPFLWWGVQWPEPPAGSDHRRAALLDGGFLDCLVAHHEGISRRFAMAMTVAKKAGGLLARNLTLGVIDGDLILDTAEATGRIGDRINAARRMLQGFDHASRVDERGRDRLLELQQTLRTILGPAGLGPFQDATTPIVLWLDDAQWMTSDEVHMLQGLWNDAVRHHLPLLIVVTHWESPWRQDVAQAIPTDADGRPRPTRFAQFAANIDPARVDIHDIETNLDFSGVLRAALPGLTESQHDLILNKTHGHPLLFRLIVDHYLHRPRSFLNRDARAELTVVAMEDLQSIAVDKALESFARRKIRDLDDTVREVLGWSSVQGIRFLRQVTAAISRIELGSEAPVDSALDTAVDPEAIIQIAGSANQRSFRQNIFREIMLSDLGADRAHIEEAVREITRGWLENGDLESRLSDAELDDFLLLATSHLDPAGSANQAESATTFDVDDPSHHAWIEASRMRLERSMASGQWTLAAESARKLRGILDALDRDAWVRTAPMVAGDILEVMHRGGDREEMRAFAAACESGLQAAPTEEIPDQEEAVRRARLWRALGFVHQKLGEPHRQLACFKSAEEVLTPFRASDDVEVAYGIARSLHYQASAVDGIEGATEAGVLYRIVAGLWRELLEIAPDHIKTLEGLGATLNNLANCESDSDPLRATAASEEALSVKEKAIVHGGETAERLTRLMTGHGTHSHRLEAIGQQEKAGRHTRLAAEMADRLILLHPHDAEVVDTAIHWLNVASRDAESSFDFKDAFSIARRSAEASTVMLERSGVTARRIELARDACEHALSAAQRLNDATAVHWSESRLDAVDEMLFAIETPTTGLVMLTASVILQRTNFERPVPEGVVESCLDRILEALAGDMGIEGRIKLLDAADSIARCASTDQNADFETRLWSHLDATESFLRERSAEEHGSGPEQLRRLLGLQASMARIRGDAERTRTIRTEVVGLTRRLMAASPERSIEFDWACQLANELWEIAVDAGEAQDVRSEAGRESLEILEAWIVDGSFKIEEMDTAHLGRISRLLETYVQRHASSGSDVDIVPIHIRTFAVDHAIWSQNPSNLAALRFMVISSAMALNSCGDSSALDLHRPALIDLGQGALEGIADAEKLVDEPDVCRRLRLYVRTFVLATELSEPVEGRSSADAARELATELTTVLALESSPSELAETGHLAVTISRDVLEIMTNVEGDRWIAEVSDRLMPSGPSDPSTWDEASARALLDAVSIQIELLVQADQIERTRRAVDLKRRLLDYLFAETEDPALSDELKMLEEQRRKLQQRWREDGP